MNPENKFYALLNANGTIKSILDESNLNNYKANIEPECLYQEINLQELKIHEQELEDIYYTNGTWNKRPVKPHDYCDWSWESYSWVNNFNRLKETSSYLIRVKLEEANLKLTVIYKNIAYNANPQSSLALEVAINNLTLGESIYWRDYDNNFQYLSKLDLQEIAKLAFDKQQDLLSRYWTKRDEIKVIEDFDTLLNYNLEL